MLSNRTHSHIDTATPVARTGYSPVYDDDARYDEEEHRSPSSLSMASASTHLLPQRNSTSRSWTLGGTAAVRRQIKLFRAKWRRGELFSGNGSGGGEGAQTVKHFLIRILHAPIFHRFIQLVLIVTVLVTTLLFVKYANKPPGKLYADIDYTQLTPFNVTAVIDSGDAAVWDPQRGLLGLKGDEEYLREGEYSVFLEMHAHTTHSDGDLTPEQLVDWAFAYGFNALVVSDHNTLSGALAAQSYANSVYNMDPDNPRILVIPAIEHTTCRIHMQLVGLTSPIPAPKKAFPTDEELQSVIDQAHAQGALVLANHLPWSLGTERNYNVPTLQHHPTREQLLDWGVDGFEILHEGKLDLPTLLFARKHGMPLISSTDMHSAEDVPHGWTLIKDTPLTIPAILEKLKNGETSFASHPTGIGKTVIWPENNPEWDKWAPLVGMDFGFLYDDIHGMYSFTGEWCHEKRFVIHQGRAAWFVIWTALAWVGYEVARWGVGIGYIWVQRKFAKTERIML